MLMFGFEWWIGDGYFWGLMLVEISSLCCVGFLALCCFWLGVLWVARS